MWWWYFVLFMSSIHSNTFSLSAFTPSHISSPAIIVHLFNTFFLQNEEKRNLSLGGHVGFDSLPDQLVSKSVTQGFCFNILCVGEYQTTW